MTGIDVSGWQGVIDWDKARTKVVFAFIKATEGVWVDRQFTRNWHEGYRVGVRRGAYLFYRANVDPGQQARTMLDALAGDYGELPIIVDLEDEEHASPWNTSQIAGLRWCLDLLEKFSGKTPIIYTRKYWFDPYIGNVTWAARYPLWVANYTYDPAVVPLMPASWKTWAYYQWSNKGIGADYGVQSEMVDLDIEAARVYIPCVGV